MSINKILVALVIVLASIGLTGVATASTISTSTDITGTQFSSTSTTTVSDMYVSSHYTQTFQADLTGSMPADYCYTDTAVVGEEYALSTEIRSSPTLNTVSTVIANPSDVTGEETRANCALEGQGIESMETTFPQPMDEPAECLWWGTHPEGRAEPAHSTEEHEITWP